MNVQASNLALIFGPETEAGKSCGCCGLSTSASAWDTDGSSGLRSDGAICAMSNERV